MKKILLISLIVLFLVITVFSSTQPQLLRILEPAGKYKGRFDLILHKQDIEAMLKDPAIDLSSGKTQVRLYDPKGNKVAKLANVKKGRIKWLFRTLPGEVLGVKMDPMKAQKLLEEACKKNRATGYQLVLTREEKRSKQLTVVKCFKLTFSQQVDLSGMVIYPLKVAPGAAMEKDVKLTVFNEGTAPAENFHVELRLAGDQQTIPRAAANENSPAPKGKLLENGRVRIDLLPPGKSVTLLFKAPLKIPANLPAGRYQLVVLLDPENVVKEVQEANNHLSRFIFITPDAAHSLSRGKEKPVDLRALTRKQRGKY